MDVLANENCRDVLLYFEGGPDDVASLEDLVEDATTRNDRTSDRNRIAIRFHHDALPRLADAGLLEYDARSHTVRYRGSPVLERCQRIVVEAERAARRTR